MERVYYDIADNFVKDLEKKLNKSIEINEKENKIKIENEIIKYEEKDIGVRSFSVPYFVENQTIINYDGNDKELTNKILIKRKTPFNKESMNSHFVLFCVQ